MVPLNDSQLRSFLVIADCGSFSQAEHILFLSKQALKKQMDALEAELQCSLFVRSPQGIQLTEAGTAFLSAAPRILREISSSLTLCRQASLHRRPIQVSIPSHPAFLFSVPTWQFCQENPDILIQYHFQTPWEDASPPQQILAGDTDVYLSTLNLRSAYPVEYTPLIQLPYVCLLPPGHPLSQRGPALSPEDLRGQELTLSRFSWSSQLETALSPYCHLSIQEESAAPELELAYNTCFAGGIFLTSSCHSSHTQPLLTLPLSLPLRQELGFLYSATAPEQVLRYVRGMKELLNRP